MDDTLYEEMTYVKSGFNAVADYLDATYNLAKLSLLKVMHEELEHNGRGKVFNKALAVNNIYSQSMVRKCLSVYRLHEPNIKLSKEAKDCLRRFSDFKKYLLTDGNKIVQSQKVKALRLADIMDGIYITHRFGLEHSKPSPYCYNRIINKENISPSEAVYIGDNPNKDFIGVKPLGYKTVRVLTGPYKNLKVKPSQQAHISINGLDELTPELIQNI